MDQDFDTRVAHGEFGAFEGAVADRVVLPKYEAQRIWAAELLSVLQRTLAGGGTLLDVGGHVGLVSIPVALSTPAQCVAFEPAPINAACFRRNVARHGVAGRVELHEVALGRERGEIAFALSPDNGGDHHVLANGALPPEGFQQTRVRCERLDDLIDASALAKPIALKLDVQGAEAKVLAGATRTLEHVSTVVLEYWPRGLLRAGDHAEQLEALLQNFSHGAVLKQGGGSIGANTLEIKTRAELFHALSHFMAHDGSDDGFFDLLLTSGRDLTDAGS